MPGDALPIFSTGFWDHPTVGGVAHRPWRSAAAQQAAHLDHRQDGRGEPVQHRETHILFRAPAVVSRVFFLPFSPFPLRQHHPCALGCPGLRSGRAVVSLAALDPQRLVPPGPPTGPSARPPLMAILSLCSAAGSPACPQPTAFTKAGRGRRRRQKAFPGDVTRRPPCPLIPSPTGAHRGGPQKNHHAVPFPQHLPGWGSASSAPQAGGANRKNGPDSSGSLVCSMRTASHHPSGGTATRPPCSPPVVESHPGFPLYDRLLPEGQEAPARRRLLPALTTWPASPLCCSAGRGHTGEGAGNRWSVPSR